MSINEMEILLENGDDANARYERGRQEIHAVAESGNSNIMLTFKNMGADINARDINGYAPIHIGDSFSKNNVITSLSQNSRIDINAQSETGLTPLHLAEIGEYYDAVEALLVNYKISAYYKDKGDLTALHFHP